MMTLIRNELFKIFHRKKTYVVLIGFALIVGLACFGMYQDNKNMIKYQSPEYQLQEVEGSISHMQDEKKIIETRLKDKPADKEVDLARIDSSIADLEKRRDELKKMISSGTKEESWEKKLDDEISQNEKMLETNEEKMPSEHKEQVRMQLNELKYMKEHHVKPEIMEFNSYNFIIKLIGELGAFILAIGVVVFASDMVSGECTPATLKFLLIQPVSRAKVLMSKFVAVVVSATSLIVSVELLYFVFIGVFKSFGSSSYPMSVGSVFKYDMTKPIMNGRQPLMLVENSTRMIPRWQYFIFLLLLQVLFIVACTAFAFMLSSIFKSSMVSIAVSCVSMIVLDLFVIEIQTLRKIAPFIFTSFGNVNNLMSGQFAVMFNKPGITCRHAVIVMIAWTVASYVISHFVFTRRDILI